MITQHPQALHFHADIIARLHRRVLAGVPDSSTSPGTSVMVRAMSATR
jgi:hypothetical protein